MDEKRDNFIKRQRRGTGGIFGGREGENIRWLCCKGKVGRGGAGIVRENNFSSQRKKWLGVFKPKLTGRQRGKGIWGGGGVGWGGGGGGGVGVFVFLWVWAREGGEIPQGERVLETEVGE